MANPTMYPLSSLLAGGVAITGMIAPQGSSAPTITQGRGFTVSRVSTGLFKIFPAQAYRALISFDATLQEAATAATAATLTIAGASSPNGDVLVTATAAFAGPPGNGITVATLGGTSQSLAVSVVGTAITVQVATASGGLVTTTGAGLRTAINGNASAAALVTASLPGTGATISAAHSAAPLSGGTSGAVQLQMGPISGINSSSGYIEVRTVDATAGTVVDVAANVANQINFMAVFTNSSVDA
jgi:hypothetical protein